MVRDDRRCLESLCSLAFLFSEGDAYFTVKLQDYTAVEKDEVTLDCELSKDVPVKWFHNETEIKASKMVSMKADGKRRLLYIKKVGDKDKGQYVCDCGTDKTMATVNIEGMWYSIDNDCEELHLYYTQGINR